MDTQMHWGVNIFGGFLNFVKSLNQIWCLDNIGTFNVL